MLKEDLDSNSSVGSVEDLNIELEELKKSILLFEDKLRGYALYSIEHNSSEHKKWVYEKFFKEQEHHRKSGLEITTDYFVKKLEKVVYQMVHKDLERVILPGHNNNPYVDWVDPKDPAYSPDAFVVCPLCKERVHKDCSNCVCSYLPLRKKVSVI